MVLTALHKIIKSGPDSRCIPKILSHLNEIINSSIWILPIGNDLYKVGATYNWEDKTTTKTEAGKNELLSNLKELISCEFEIIEHLAGIRPTVKDRRPLLGRHFAEIGRAHV